MASASSLLAEEQFLCPVCLDLFNDPVTLPCGHNYCKICITQHFDSNDQHMCPMCNKFFHRRPELPVNTFISEMTAQFRKSVRVQDQQCGEEVPEVPCDFCTGSKAVKSCLVCMTSYCQTHLEPHQRVSRLKTHQLIDAVENLEERLCRKHNRPLEMFCKTEGVCVCQFCCESDHKLHVLVSMKEGYEGRKAQLLQTEAQIQQMIQERRLKIQQIQCSVKLSEEDGDREMANGVKVFTALTHAIERSQAELVATIRGKQKSTERQAQAFIQELEQDIFELTKRCMELEKLSHADQLHFLQSIPFGVTLPASKDWTKVNVHRPSYVGTVRRALDQLEKTLGMETKAQCEAELKRLRQDAVDVTLDPETANPSLVLSKDGKQVFGGKVRKMPNSPERFSYYTLVLGKQSFSSGRLYYEVEVKGKTHWELGVVRESINRKEPITMSPMAGLWTIYLKKGNGFRACGSPAVHLPPREKLQKVGVYVDYDQGLVSFYDVQNRVHIYSFTGYSFTEALCPLFSPDDDDGENYAPLIITPVNKLD